MAPGESPSIKTAKQYVFSGEISDKDLESI